MRRRAAKRDEERGKLAYQANGNGHHVPAALPKPEIQGVEAAGAAGGQGGSIGTLLQEYKCIRSDGNMVAQALSCGAVPEEKAAELIQLAYIGLQKAGMAGKWRIFATLAKIPFAGANLKLNIQKVEGPPPPPARSQVIVINGQPVDRSQFNQLPVEEKRRLLREEMGLD
jgi:hypothetical protein